MLSSKLEDGQIFTPFISLCSIIASTFHFPSEIYEYVNVRSYLPFRLKISIKRKTRFFHRCCCQGCIFLRITGAGGDGIIFKNLEEKNKKIGHE